MPRVTVTRRLHFNAAHRLWNPRWSDERNDRVFGVCGNPNYHGHNYNIDVSVEGEIDPESGYVLDINRQKETAVAKVVAKLGEKRSLKHYGVEFIDSQTDARFWGISFLSESSPERTGKA